MTDADRKRAILMLELAAEYIENHYPDGTLFYDGTDKAQILIHRYFDAAWKQGRKGIGYSDTQLPEHKELILYVFDLEHRLAVAEAKNQTYEEHIDELGDRSDTCVYSVINRVCSFCQCKRRGDTQW